MTHTMNTLADNNYFLSYKFKNCLMELSEEVYA